MKREELATVFYGKGRMPIPWATDCPVRFDVWLKFAQPTQSRGDRVDVILGVNEEHGVRRVLDLLRQNAQASQPIAAGSFVLATVTLDELVRVVLPMTNLYAIVRFAQQQTPPELEAIASRGEAKNIIPTPTGDGPERIDENKRHLLWLARLLVAVQEGASGAGSKRSKTSKEAAHKTAAENGRADAPAGYRSTKHYPITGPVWQTDYRPPPPLSCCQRNYESQRRPGYIALPPDR